MIADQQTLRPVSAAVDVSAPPIIAFSFLGWLGPTLSVLASLMLVIWYMIQISESDRFHQAVAWLRRRIGAAAAAFAVWRAARKGPR